MIKPSIPADSLDRIASKSSLSSEDIIRKTKAVIQLANSGQQKLVMQMIRNTRQEWLFESLLQGCKIQNGRVHLGKNLRNMGKNGEYFFTLLLGYAPPGCILGPQLDRNMITELDLGSHLTSIDWVKKFALELHPIFPNLVKIRSQEIKLNIDAEFEQLDQRQKQMIIRTFRACTVNLKLYLEKIPDCDFFMDLLDGFSFDLSLTGPGAKFIPEKIIDILCRFDGLIKLPDLEELNSIKLARKLWQRCYKVSLPKLRAISDPIVEMLAVSNDLVDAPLIQADFSTLDPQQYTAAHILCRRGLPLNLDSMQSIPEKLWKTIARHDEAISMNGLTHLEDRFALLLARHRHSLSLDGITFLSPRAKRLLQYRCGKLSLKGLNK